jgi:hypothetical protein
MKTLTRIVALALTLGMLGGASIMAGGHKVAPEPAAPAIALPGEQVTVPGLLKPGVVLVDIRGELLKAPTALTPPPL